ncbi:MAG: hypothetical protein E7578_06250 [Ruminococcaceae bacterium]|nr:hypothetical protein [Oscillospiraceae bacterium]
MDICTDQIDRSFTDGDGFWLVCSLNGSVNICSSMAAKYGIVLGVDDGCRVIHEDHLPDFEDALRMIGIGGTVSVLLDANEDTKYTVAHVRNGVLFSEPVVEIRLYKNKNEYLADPNRNNPEIGRVFDYTFNSDAVAKSTEGVFSSAENIKNRISRFEKSVMIMLPGFDHVIPGEDSLIDVSAIFDSVAERFLSREKIPFVAEFENLCNGSPVICFGKTEDFVGAILAASAVAVRISRNGKCRVIFRYDGDAAVIEVRSKIDKAIPLCFKSCELSWLYAAIGMGISELAFLEHLFSLEEYHVEFMCDIDGGFVLRITVNKNSDPDRLKFRDGTCGAVSFADEYIDYLCESFLSDPEK